MDSLSLLRESLPNGRLQASEQEMSMEFRAAAQSLATFYRSSKQTVKHAHDAGYAACLQDMLQFIQTGLSDDTMGVARVMDWVEGQLGRYADGKDLGLVESADEASTVQRSSPRPSSPPTRRASTSTEIAPLVLDSTPSTKRRHAAITVDTPARRRRALAPTASTEPRPTRRGKRAGAQDPRPESMDYEDDGPRDRKRSRTSSNLPTP